MEASITGLSADASAVSDGPSVVAEEDGEDPFADQAEAGSVSDVDGSVARDHSLPVVCSNRGGAQELIDQQRADQTLEEARQNAVGKRDGFSYNQDGMLTHSKLSNI